MKTTVIDAASATVEISSDEVQVWAIALDARFGEHDDVLECLSSDERARAERFCFDRDRRRFVAARSALRGILGSCLGVPARRVAFRYGPHGKPALANPTARDVEFNLSHSQGLALVAIAAGRRVGVDLETLRPGVSSEGIAERFFSAWEVAALQALPVSRRDEAFFACWTRKEAYLKARGEGLSMPLDAFSVSLAPGEPAALLDCSAAPDEVRAWSFRSFSPAPGFLGALVVEGADWRLRLHRWSPGAQVSEGDCEFT